MYSKHRAWTTGNLKDAIIYAKIGSEYKNYGISLPDGAYIADKLPPGNYTLTAIEWDIIL